MAEFKAMQAGYRNLWDRMHVTRPTDAEKAAAGMLEDKARYEAVEQETGVPWFWIGCVHDRESNRSFGGVLHNGERIIGTGRKTTLVPKGRGPFDSWDKAAIDALTYPVNRGGKELDKVEDWTVERVLYEFERYNGFGYNGKINSPYVWAGTSNQQRGKFVADHVFDQNHWDTQLGTAAILKQLASMDETVAARLDPDAVGESSTLPGSSDDAAVPPPVVTLGQFSTDALVAELLARPNIVDVNISFNSSGK